MDTKNKVIKWLLSDDTGESSRAIVSQMMGIEKADGWGDHPTDGYDFARCHRLLEAIPEFMVRIEEMAQRSPQWAVLVECWGDLTQLYQNNPEKMTRHMHSIIEQILSEVPDKNSVDMGSGVAVDLMSKD